MLDQLIIIFIVGVIVFGGGSRCGGSGYSGFICIILNYGWMFFNDLYVVCVFNFFIFTFEFIFLVGIKKVYSVSTYQVMWFVEDLFSDRSVIC